MGSCTRRAFPHLSQLVPRDNANSSFRRTYRYKALNKGLEYAFMAVFHILIVTGVALVGAGAGGLTGDNPESSDLTHLKVGMALLEIGWGTLVVWTLWTLKERSDNVSTAWEGSVVRIPCQH